MEMIKLKIVLKKQEKNFVENINLIWKIMKCFWFNEQFDIYIFNKKYINFL